MESDYVSLADARKQLGELLARATYGGHRIVVTKHGKSAAAIVSMEDLARLQNDAPISQVAAPEPVPPWTDTVDIPATRAKVWFAMFDSRRRVHWWPLVEIDPEVGCEFIARSVDEADDLSGRFTEFDEGNRFQVQWADGTHTTVELSGENGSSTVTVTHTAGQPPAGWRLDLDALRAYLL